MTKLLTLLLLCSAFYCHAQPANQIAVAVNASVTVKQLSHSQLRRIFTMRQNQWPNGDPITVFVLDNDDPYHQQFAKSMLDLFPYQLDKLWNKLVYSGQGERPIEVKNLAIMQQQLSQIPGAIGYLEQQSTLPNINFIVIKEEQ